MAAVAADKPSPDPRPWKPVYLERTQVVEKPNNINAIGALLLAGGVMTVMVSVGMAIATFGLWLPWIYGVIAGTYSIIRGSTLLGDNAAGTGVPTSAPAMLILNVLNCDMMSMVMGIVALALMQDPQARAYLTGQQQDDNDLARGHQAGRAKRQAVAATAAAPIAEVAPLSLPSPDSWGPPPAAKSAAETAKEDAAQDSWAAPSWGGGWGSEPLANMPDPPGATLPDDLLEPPPPLKTDGILDDMADWERRFAEAVETEEVGASAWSHTSKK